jgi:hypothetical protein
MSKINIAILALLFAGVSSGFALCMSLVHYPTWGFIPPDAFREFQQAAAIRTAPAKRKAVPPITVRTESYPRPPYSGATYYIYEQSGRTICTKLEVCNKFGDCSSQYVKGAYRADVDKDTGDPYDQSPAILIPPAKLNKHVCLRRFKLIAT